MPEELTECDVMIVAEQPTRTDDDYGRLFSGRGLKEIKTYFKEQGLSVHFAYAVKCVKPDKDTKPKASDIKTCRTNYLAKEIEIVRPKHIIALGGGAIQAIIGRPKKITEVQGTRFKDEKTGAWIYATLHFAQAAYSEANKQTMWSDLKLFTKWIIGGEAEVTKFDPPVYVVDTLKGLRNLERRIANSGGIVAVDTETQGLNPYHPDRHIRTIQFCWDAAFGGVCVPLEVGEGCYYTEKGREAKFWTQESLADAIKIIRRILYNSKLIWHNGKFDRIWLHMWGKRNFGSPIRCPNIYMDTMHVAYLLDENRALKLKRLITAELGFPSYDIPDKMTLDMDVLIPYSTKDTVASLLLAQKYAAMLCDPDLLKLRKFYFNVMRRADALYTKMEIRGWPAHAETARRVKGELEVHLRQVEKEMHEILAGHGITLEQVPSLDENKQPIFVKGEALMETPVFASPPKLGKLLWGELGLMHNPDDSIAYTNKEKTALSTKEDALIHVKHHPFVGKLLEWRGVIKALQTYAGPMLRGAETRGKLTTVYKLAKVVTGRTASGKEEGSGAAAKTAEGMNLQNIPPTFGIKNIIQCPDSEDEWIMECDFSQIELRIAGELSGDPMLLWAYQNNVDLHTYRAMRTMGLDQAGWDALSPKEQKKGRQNAKPCIAEGSLVLTNEGLIPIERVQLRHLLWDGVEWVEHGGVEYRGRKPVITVQGLTATPGHTAYLESGGKATMEEINAKDQLRIATTEINGNPVRYIDFNRGGLLRKEVSGNQRQMLRLRRNLHLRHIQHPVSENYQLPMSAWAARRGQQQKVSKPKSKAPGRTVRFDTPAMRQPAGSQLPKLRGTWNTKPFYQAGVHSLVLGKPAPRILQRGADRPEGQRRTLRAGELASCYFSGKFAQQAHFQVYGVYGDAGQRFRSLASAENGLSRKNGTRLVEDNHSRHQRNFLARNTREKTLTVPPKSGSKKVYDIIGAGPRHRFTVSGKLVENCNFGFLYGMSHFRFRQFALVQYGIDFSMTEAKENRELFYRDHHGLEKWYGKQERMCQRLGYVESLSGRRRRLPDIRLNPDSSKEAKSKYKDAVRQAINSPVQGFGSDLKLMAAIEIDMALDPKVAKIFGEIHDSILLRVKKHAILEVASIVLPIMRHPRLLDVLGIDLKVPIEAEIAVGPSLGEKKELHKWPEFEHAA